MDKGLFDKIIPPSDYHHRNGFTNKHLIDQLDQEGKHNLEDILVERLLNETGRGVDTLIVETLAYLKSNKSIPILRRVLANCINDPTIIVLAISLFEITKESAMIDIALRSFRNLESEKDAYQVFKLVNAFYYLGRFGDSRLSKILSDYSRNDNPLLAYNASRALNELNNQSWTVEQ